MTENNFDFLKALDDLIIEHGGNLEDPATQEIRARIIEVYNRILGGFTNPTIAGLGENGKEATIPIDPNARKS